MASEKSRSERPTPEVLRSLLAPKSVAVVGASDQVFTFSGAPLHNLAVHGYSGATHPVNPRRTEVAGMVCYPSVLAIPEAVDTAVITVPASAVVGVLEDCERAGLLSATVVSAGFGEDGAGEEGQENARRLEEFLATSRLRVLGPNTAGLMNLLDEYVPRAAVNHLDAPLLRAGQVALVTQSGACSNIVFNRAQAGGVGIGVMAATGGECDISVWDLVEHLLQDPRVSVAMVVIEAMGSVARMREVAAEARRVRKPIVLLKLGSSELGSEVVLTHSGSIAGDAAVARAAFAQWGIVQVDDFDALWQTARLFEAWGTPAGDEGDLGVFAFSGGEAALIADHASGTALTLPGVSADFTSSIRHELAYAKAANPFDATGELVGRPEKLLPVLASFLDDNSFTEVLVATPVYRREAAERILPQLVSMFQARGATGPRVVFSMWPAGPLTEAQAELLAATGRPVLADSTRAVAAVGRYVAYRRHLDAEPPPVHVRGGVFESAPPADGAVYSDVRHALEAAGLPFAPARRVVAVEDAVAAARDLGYPLVMKGDVPSTVHKALGGLVAIGIRDEASVRSHFDRISSRAEAHGGVGVVVEPMMAASLQCFLGARRDADFGLTLVFGLGGSAAEFLDDTALLVVEGDAPDVTGLVGATRVGAFLQRDYPKVGAQLAEALANLAAWLQANPEVSDVDLNPVMVDTTSGAVTCVDGRVALEDRKN